MESKKCGKCGEVKLTSEFWKGLGPGGWQTYCKKCHSEKSKERYESLSDVEKARYKKKAKAQKYGMSVEEFDAYVEAHSDLCDICGEPESTQRKRNWTRNLTMDHCHKTGRVRGMLCSNCNIGLGNFRDRPDLLLSAMKYLDNTT